MTPTPEQIEAAEKLARMMKERDIKWQWQVGDWYIAPTFEREALTIGWENPQVLALSPNKEYFEDCIPIPTFEQCLDMMKWRDWYCGELRYNSSRRHYKLFMKLELAGVTLDVFWVFAKNLQDVGILALTEVIRRIQ